MRTVFHVELVGDPCSAERRQGSGEPYAEHGDGAHIYRANRVFTYEGSRPHVNEGGLILDRVTVSTINAPL